MQDTEIEMKVQIDKDIYEKCKEYLLENASFISSKTESDQYFNSPRKNFLAPEYPYEWLRVRKSDKHVMLNYKHWYPKNSPISTHCDELEAEVSDHDTLMRIFQAIGINLLITVNKYRQKFRYCDDLEICLDYISELGYFIEIEFVGANSSILHAHSEIIKLAELLSLDLSKKDNRGYPYLMLEKKNLLKKYKNDKQDRRAVLSLF
jgi:predicted adenylyl cyclase CyaB